MSSGREWQKIHVLRGRGATASPQNRYADTTRCRSSDSGFGANITDYDEYPTANATVATRLEKESSRRVITYNRSPDVPFDRSINPYRGCEHGCIYCFARPSHAWLDLSPGLDFETRLFYKPEAPEQLAQELQAPGYQCQPIALGINTDAYQPAERKLELTRRIIEVLVAARHPFTIVTKSSLVERDLDLLGRASQDDLVTVMVSLTTLDKKLARVMEPRAASPGRRLETVRALATANIPVGVLIAPVIPVLTDPELETLVAEAANAGARDAGYVMLRMPHEIKDLFEHWLEQNYPLKAAHVLNAIRSLHDGRLYSSRFGQRMTGSGALASMVSQRFRLARKRNRFSGLPALNTQLFSVRELAPQMSLF